jgi:hypothetical protein
MVVREARDAGAVPEPSPFFWNQLSARVAAATDAEPIQPLTWWDRAWRPVAAVSAVAAAAVLVVGIFDARPEPESPTSPTPVAAAVVSDSAVDEATLELMVQMATDVSNEELQSARPDKEATAAVIADLTPEQQAEFIRLIKAEIGDIQ